MGKLVANNLKRLPDGLHGDGAGLYLRVRGNSRSWIYRYRDATGALRDMGLGSLTGITLANARLSAKKHREGRRDGTDPLKAKRDADMEARLEAAKEITFGQCADALIDTLRPSWRNAKHAQQWENTIATYCADMLALPVQAIDTRLVQRALSPIWTTKTETATRLRQRIEAVLDWATAREYRTGENPARWKGHLANLLAKPEKLKRKKPRAAVPYEEIGAFWRDLRAVDSLASLALQWQVLTATRPVEAVGARWDEIDTRAKVWTIPGERMKAGRAHRVPLSAELLAMLGAMPHREGWLFPGRYKGHLSTAATLKLIRELRPGMTCHGFRSTFRDWAGDFTAYPREVAEAALAHTLRDKTEAAYRRRDALDKRARLMQDWATFCGTLPTDSAKVTPIRKRRA